MRGMLDLSEHQAAEVKKILTERHKAILGLRRQIQPQVEKELEEAKEVWPRLNRSKQRSGERGSID